MGKLLFISSRLFSSRLRVDTSLGSRSYLCLLFLCGVIAIFAQPQSIHAQEYTQRPTREYQIKASLIYNFLQFIEWPPETWEPSGGTLRLCVVGSDPFGVALSPLEKEIVQGKKIEVHRLTDGEGAKRTGCHVVYVTHAAVNEVPTVVAISKESSVLTIGETPNFLDQGGIIALLLSDGKIVFDINQSAATQARLYISSQLLRIARRATENEESN